MCQPILLHGLDCMLLGKLGKQMLETSQENNLLKQCLWLSNLCHSKDLCKALKVQSIYGFIGTEKRQCKFTLSLQSLCTYFVSCMVSNGTVIPRTLADRVLQNGFSSVQCGVNFNKRVEKAQTDSRVVDSWRSFYIHEHFIKPYSE